MNGRRVFREYAKSKGIDAKEFIRIEKEWYEQDTLFVKDSDGNLKTLTINYREMVHWMFKKYKEK